MSTQSKAGHLSDKERADYILQELGNGRSREDVAQDFNYSNYKSLDIFMRRKNYRYDKNLSNYVPEVEGESLISDGTKASRIVELIAACEGDYTNVLYKVGFSSMEKLGQYMASKNYHWNSELQNYELEERDLPEIKQTETNQGIDQKPILQDLSRYAPLLEQLMMQEDRLIELLTQNSNHTNIPRYKIRGIAKTKTVQMIHTLGDLVTEYAEEHNMAQRDIFEVALVDFFRKYGYSKEVDRVLSH